MKKVYQNRYQPKVLEDGVYSIEVGEPAENRIKKIQDLKPLEKGKKKEITVKI